MARLSCAALTLLLLALVPAACGGSGSAPTKQEFVKNAEKICNDAQKRLKRVGAKASSPDQIANAVDAVINETQRSVDRLQGLDRPEGVSGTTAKKFVTSLQSEVEAKGIPALKDLRDALKHRDQAKAKAAAKKLQGIRSPQADKYARQLGVTACVG
jgi:hypothetical protein